MAVSQVIAIRHGGWFNHSGSVRKALRVEMNEATQTRPEAVCAAAKKSIIMRCLIENASDETIRGNLELSLAHTPDDAFLVATLIRDDKLRRELLGTHV